MSRGTIMALERKTAVVLTPGGEFVRVRRLPGFELGAEIVYAAKQGAARVKRWMLAGASAAALLVVLVGLWLLQPPSVVAYVTMDVNPSVEIGLDKNMHVRELRAVNRDAEAIVSGVKYKGKALEEVMSAVADKLAASRPLLQDEVVIVSVPVKAVAAEWETRVADTVKTALSAAAKKDAARTDAELDVTTLSVPKEVRKAANEQGISAGKMAFWLAAEDQGHEVPIETLKKQSMKKIAAEWGGVKKVLESESNRKSDKEAWKKLLEDAKAKKKLPEVKSSPKPSKPSEGPNPGKDDRGGNGKHGNGKSSDDDRKGQPAKPDDNGNKNVNNGNSGNKGNNGNTDNNDNKGNNGNKDNNGNKSNNGKKGDNGRDNGNAKPPGSGSGKSGDKDRNDDDRKSDGGKSGGRKSDDDRGVDDGYRSNGGRDWNNDDRNDGKPTNGDDGKSGNDGSDSWRRNGDRG